MAGPPHRLPTLIGKALLAHLQADAELASACRDGIKPIESEDVLFEAGLAPVFLGVAPEALDLKPSTADFGELEVVFSLVLVTPARTRQVEDDWLRFRLVSQIAHRLWSPPDADPSHGRGVLLSEAGEPLTEALTRVQRVPSPILDASTLRTVIRVLYRAQVDGEIQFTDC